jgi:acyl-coenzyme A synthetase/AMP-(fatty) acid ligase
MLFNESDSIVNKMPPYKYPRAFEFVSFLPKTETGKIRRFKLN